MDEYKQKLGALMTELKGNTTHVREVWDDQVPCKVGFYHVFA